MFATTGTVLASQVESYHDDGLLMYRARVTYEYMVQNRRYVNDRIYSFQISNSIGTAYRAKHDEIVSRYPVGSETTVYYDQRDPRQAYLRRGIGPFTVLLTAFSLAAVALALVFIVAIVGL